MPMMPQKMEASMNRRTLRSSYSMVIFCEVAMASVMARRGVGIGVVAGGVFGFQGQQGIALARRVRSAGLGAEEGGEESGEHEADEHGKREDAHNTALPG